MEDEGTRMFTGGKCVGGGEVCGGLAAGDGEEEVGGRDECKGDNVGWVGDWISGVGCEVGWGGMLLDWFDGDWCKEEEFARGWCGERMCGGGAGGWCVKGRCGGDTGG